jgi:hypothetical protein
MPSRQLGSRAKNPSTSRRRSDRLRTVRPPGVDAMNLENMLGQVEPDDRDTGEIG